MVKQNIMSGNRLIPDSLVPIIGNKRGYDRRGFTLIELLIVVSIIGILAAIAVPNYQWGVIKAREAVLREDLYNFRSVIDQFRTDQGKYPDSLMDLVEKKYMRDLPKDPITGNNEWEPVPPPAEDPPLPQANLGNVYDVHSKSDKISPTTNTPYKEW